MRKITSLVFLVSMLLSCGQVKKHETESKRVNAKQTTSTTRIKRPRFNSLTEVIEPKEVLRYWASKESYYPTLHFDNRDTLWIEFDGQCEYTFPYKLKGKNIVVYWDIIEDCSHEIGLKKSFGLKNKPIKGKPFMTFRLADDTTLQATYVFRDWTESVNKGYNGYQYFPDLFLSCGE